MPKRVKARGRDSRVLELENALERAREASEGLRRVGMAVGATGELDELLTLIVEVTTQVLHGERATLYLREGDQLVSRVKIGDAARAIRVPLGHGIAGHVAKTGRVERIRDAPAHPRFDPSWDQASGFQTRSMLAVPINDYAGATVGVLQVLNKVGADGATLPFTRYDTEILRALAAQAAVSIDKAQLFARMTSTTERLERSLRDFALLYELETAMSRADSMEDLARCVIAKVATACGASGGAVLHATHEGRLVQYLANVARPNDVLILSIRPGDGIAARAHAERRSQASEGKAPAEPRRFGTRLGLHIGAAIAEPLCGDCGGGAIAVYGAGTKRFGVEDQELLRLVSANVATQFELLEARGARERARRLETIGHLLSGVMHDLRTPLTVIRGNTQLMELCDDPRRRREHGRVVTEQFAVIRDMQHDLLAYARGEAHLLMRSTELRPFLEALCEQVRAEATRVGVRIELELSEGGSASFDAGKLARALLNLMHNAVEAMADSGGSLSLRTRRDGDRLIIDVSDTGPGLPAEIASRLFEPFVTKGKPEGTGLGLYNARKIVEEHDGTVSVSTSSKGTTFSIVLPRGNLLSRRPPSSRNP
ncbi:MAG: GAF domain-containing protein [Myxococcales bacterium]|nr:GAF domain-containing protein [Myxococcales bacterium]